MYYTYKCDTFYIAQSMKNIRVVCWHGRYMTAAATLKGCDRQCHRRVARARQGPSRKCLHCALGGSGPPAGSWHLCVWAAC